MGKHGLEQEPSRNLADNLWYSQDRRKKQALDKAQSIGTATAIVVQRIWSRAALVAYWECIDVFRCSRQYSPARVERAACQLVALGLGGVNGLRSILEESLDLIAGTKDMETDDVQFLLPFMGGLLDAHHFTRA